MPRWSGSHKLPRSKTKTEANNLGLCFQQAATRDKLDSYRKWIELGIAVVNILVLDSL